MRYFVFFIALSGACLSACSNDSNAVAFDAEGEIIGADLALCPCCGGWLLQTTDTLFRFNELPAGSDIDLVSATFPVPVKFSYEADTFVCGAMMNRILITDIEKQ